MIKDLPQLPGVYLMKDRVGKIFYVGKSKNLKERVKSYFIDRFDKDEKTKKILSTIYDLSYERVGSELEALLLEQEYIKRYQPEINTQVNVHSLATSTIPPKKIILFLPAVSERHFTLFLANKKVAATKILMDKSNLDWEMCDRFLHDFFYSAQPSDGIYNNEQIELIWRWFNINHDYVNFIDIDSVGGEQNCSETIKKYMKDDELLRQKINYI